jgi:hypothetical protein
MDSLAKTISSLEARRADLARELGQIDERLAAVATLLEGRDENTQKADSNPHNGTKLSATKRHASKSSRRSWFARDEAAKLFRKAARTAKPAADLVREVAALKGYAETLSPDDMRRFQGAAFMAITQAVRAGALKRRKNGAFQAT